MEAVYEELDEAKAEVEKLREQYRLKLELSESLKRAHNDQLSKNKEASSKLEKLTQELDEKDDEILAAREKYEELKSKLTEKESIIKHLTAAHNKLRSDCNEKLQKCEEESKALGLALDEANAKNMDQEQQILALKEEIEGVKRLHSFSQKKCLDSENRSKISKELKGMEENEFYKLDDEKRKFEDQLKWKKEQFAHLEEAHRKLKNEFKTKEKEWEKEKNVFLDGISSLETKLESQTRISQDLQRRVEMCNQALAHAESKRKLLEAQLLESRTNFDNVCSEYEEAKLSFDNLTAQRDQEIANLRSSLSTKEILYKEMEYQFKKMEEENKELMVSLKELQEAQIREAGFSYSSSKLQNKLKSLEEAHKGCLTNLKAKESEWHSQMEKLSEELNSCRSALKIRDNSLNELNRELEACDSLILKLELLNEETSLVLLVFKSQFSEVRLRISADNDSCMNLKNKQLHENMNELVEQLEQKKAALNSVQKDLEGEREKVVILTKKVQALEELQFPLQKEVERLKEMLKESTTCQLQSEEQVLQIQSDLEKVHDALDRANRELYEKFCEANEIEYELQIWKSVAEQLEANLKQNHQMRGEIEASLLEQMEVEVDLKQEKETLCHQLEEKEKRIDDLQQQLLVEANEKEETLLHQLVEEKDQRIYDLQQLVASLEKEFESSTGSFSSRLSRMQKETNVLRESWEKIKETQVLKEMEIEEKNILITELENDLGESEKKIQEIQDELNKKELEVHKLENELEGNIIASERTIKKITEQNMSLSSENNYFLNNMGLLSERMEELTVEDMQLMQNLEKMVQGRWSGDSEEQDDDDPLKENMENNILASSSPLTKKTEAVIHDERSPLRAINY